MAKRPLGVPRSLRAAGLSAVSLLALTGLGCGTSNSTPSDAGAAPPGPVAPPQPDCSADGGDWPMFGQNVCNTRSAPGSGITTANVAKLTKKWSYAPPVPAGSKTPTAYAAVSATPSVVAGSVYFPDWGGDVRKVDAVTGKLLWDDSVAALLTDPGAPPLSGYASRTTPVVVGSLVIFGTMRQVPDIITSPALGAFLVAVDKDTGAFQWKIPLHGGNPAAIITGSPVVDGHMLYIGVSSLEEVFAGLSPGYSCCSFRGSVAAVDVSKASIVWQTPTISDALYYAPPGGLGAIDGGSSDGGDAGSNDAGGGARALSGYAGNAVWSSTPVIDRKRSQIYVTTGQNYKVPDGAQEKIDGNRYDAIMALDLATGAVKWSQSFGDGTDIWTFGSMSGPDADFGAGANLFTAMIGGVPKDLVGAGQKNGVYWAVDADTGSTVWHTQVGPGGHTGGVHWGTATDGIRVYVGVNNEAGTPFMLGGTGPSAGKMTKSGAWTALDPANGHILWQIADPAMSAPLNGATVNGPVTVVNGVLFGGSMDAKGTMFALDAATGNVLWSFQSGATVYGGPAVSGGVVYWGSGYPSARLQFGTLGTQELYAFQIAD